MVKESHLSQMKLIKISNVILIPINLSNMLFPMFPVTEQQYLLSNIPWVFKNNSRRTFLEHLQAEQTTKKKKIRHFCVKNSYCNSQRLMEGVFLETHIIWIWEIELRGKIEGEGMSPLLC